MVKTTDEKTKVKVVDAEIEKTQANLISWSPSMMLIPLWKTITAVCMLERMIHDCVSE